MPEIAFRYVRWKGSEGLDGCDETSCELSDLLLDVRDFVHQIS